MFTEFPNSALPKSIVAGEVEKLAALGVEFRTNVVIGKTLTVDELLEDGYEAVYIASGAGLPMFMNIPGESLKGVYSANEFLTRSNLMKAYREDSDTPIMKGGRVAVVGGGNVAMDAARTALRLGADKVYIVYRRSMDELPARREEVEHAQEEGIELKLLTNPVEILGYNNPDNPRDERNGFVTGMRCIRMRLGEPDERGRCRPEPIPDSEFTLEVDTVVMSIGTTPNPLIKSTTDGLDVNSRGGIITDEHGATSRKGVFAGGDAVTGAATVISAMGAGKTAAAAICEYLDGQKRLTESGSLGAIVRSRTAALWHETIWRNIFRSGMPHDDIPHGTSHSEDVPVFSLCVRHAPVRQNLCGTVLKKRQRRISIILICGFTKFY